MEYEDEELAQCPECEAIIPADALTCPECGAEFEEEEEDITEGLGEELFGEEEEDEEEEEDRDEKEREKKRLNRNIFFPLGLGLAILGLAGVAGLRTGIVQSVFFGVSNGGAAIGEKEWMGIYASIGLFALGLILIWIWGNSEE